MRQRGTTWGPTTRAQLAARVRFERLVLEVLEAIPEPFASRMDNLEVLIEDRGMPGLLGLYEGIPLDQRDASYTNVMPDLITIYRIPIEMRCRNDDDLAREVRTTVLHEVAHHFGIDDDRLDELGWS